MSIATFIAFCLRYRRILMYAAGAIAVLLALWWAVSGLVNHGRVLERAEWEARQRAAEAKAAQDTKLLNEAIAEIDTGITIDMEAVNAVRTVYRDKIRTVAIAADRPDCAIADGLRAQINAAASDYAAAASANNSAVRPAKPSP